MKKKEISPRMKHIIFELRKIKTRNCEGINKLPNAKNCYVLGSKLRPVKTFKVKKNATLQERGISG